MQHAIREDINQITKVWFLNLLVYGNDMSHVTLHCYENVHRLQCCTFKHFSVIPVNLLQCLPIKASFILYNNLDFGQ